jgi:tagatose-6-phosphate ketose/aldose isomerase
MSAFSETAGAWHTAREIAQQPSVWPKVITTLEEKEGTIRDFLSRSGVTGSAGARETAIVLTGAGSSDYIGRAVAGSLGARMGRAVTAVGTTHLVTHPVSRLDPVRRHLVIHFARSGDSPESMAAWRLLHRERPDARHVVITCNEAGALGRAAAADPASLLLALPPETNDLSLAMTSSFTSMALCGIALGWIDELPALRRRMEPVCAAARRIIETDADAIEAFSGRGFDRACFLGSDVLEGAMNEGALKMLEMTAAQVTAISNSFLGIRHGPMVFVNGRCIVVACLSSETRVRRYELDLLRTLRARRQGAGVLGICSGDDPGMRGCVDLPVRLDGGGAGGSGGQGGSPIADDLRVLTDVVVCQILAFCASRAHGLSPDNPSPDGVISRVVQGVTLYDREP